MADARVRAILTSSLDNLLEGVQIISPEWRYLYVNSKAAEHGRTQPSALIGRTMMECYPGIEKTRLFAVLRQAMESREPRRLRNEFEYSQGEMGSFELRVMPVPEGLCIFTLDITEQERTQASLSERNEELHLIAEHVRDMLFLALPTGRLRYVNPAFERLLGYSRDELLAMDPSSLVHPDDVTELQDWSHLPRAEFRVRCANGTWLWMEGFTQALTPSREGLVAGVLRDVTDRKIMEQTLRSEGERTRFAMSAAKMGVWELDESTGAIWLSETMEEVCRVPRGKGPKTWSELADYVSADDLPRLEENLQQARNSDTEVNVELRFSPPDGNTIWLQGRGRFVSDADGEPRRFIGVGIDVTERRAIEAQFRQAQKAEAIGRLAGGVAHDFNNLLTVILGFGQFVADGFPEDDPRRTDMAEVLAAANRAKALTRQLLAFSRKQVLQPSVVDLNSIVAGMERLLTPLIGEDVQLETDLASELAPVFVDVHQIEQAIVNLAVNARDAMPDGGVLRMETFAQSFSSAYATREFLLPAGRYVVLSVSDNGMGMNEETRSRVFEPFFTTKGPKGTGLGLASVHGSVKQLGGFISVYSELGLGTTFKVYFPARDDAVTSEAGHEVLMPVKGTERILVVEDDESVRALIVKLLNQLGYRTLVAESPEAACQLVASRQAVFDLLISDVIMPRMNGLELVEKIRRVQPEAKVLLVSGYSEGSLSILNIAHRDIALLQKPFDAHTLGEAVRRTLAGVTRDVPGALNGPR